MSEPILIGVGATAAQMLAVRVLSYTIHRHTRRPVEVIPLCESGIALPVPQDPANAPRTPFSFQRFLLPELGGFARRSIYLDSDMIVFSDIGELYDTPMDGDDVLVVEPTPGRSLTYSVLLLAPQCPWQVGEIVGRLDRGELGYEELMFEFRVPGRVAVRIPWKWNSLERYQAGETALLHFTDMWRQPWLVQSNPLAPLWVRALFEAIDAGFVARDQVADGVARRWLRPSLLWQVEERVEDPRALPLHVRLRDVPFTRHCRRLRFRIF
jgi:hypothetical protein